MKIGIYLRNMGAVSTRETVLECARAAEAAGLDDVWVADHVAIPPDDAEGSGGRYLDPLATLAFLSAGTARIGLGTGVLILPYRPPLATAKWVATIQELSGNRLRLGVGAGWMKAEFRALGVDRTRRDALADSTLEFIRRCFASDEVEANGQRFLFLPRPERPPMFVGGWSDAALRRAVRLGDGWMPSGGDPELIRTTIVRLRTMAAEAGRSELPVTAILSLPLDDAAGAADQLLALADAGVSGVVHGSRYADAAEFRRNAEALASLCARAPSG